MMIPMDGHTQVELLLYPGGQHENPNIQFLQPPFLELLIHQLYEQKNNQDILMIAVVLSLPNSNYILLLDSSITQTQLHQTTKHRETLAVLILIQI